MTDISGLRRQHDAALIQAEEAQGCANRLLVERRREDACGVLLALARLTGVLTVHFAQEDEQLYPMLMACGSEEVAGTARRFFAEMGHIGPLYAEFVEHWNAPDPIMADIEGFHLDLSALLEALADRIRREDEQLYPLADALAPIVG